MGWFTTHIRFFVSFSLQSIFLQTLLGLAAAEEAYEFEHRDLHWGNLLLKPTTASSQATFEVDGQKIAVPTAGIKVSIIDFTLSRLEVQGELDVQRS